MAVRTATLPSQLMRWLAAPAIFCALFAAVVSVIRARTRPALPRMSGEWLKALDRRPDGG